MARPESTRNPDGAQESAQGLQFRDPENQNGSQKMFLSVEAKSAKLLCIANGSSFRTELLFECAPHPGSANLEIGPRHVFGYAVDDEVGKGRIRCDFRIRVRRRGTLSAEGAEKLGEFIFYADFPNPESAMLEICAYFDDKVFADIADGLKAGRTPETIYIEIEREHEFDYVPGSLCEWINWRIADTEELSHVDVAGLTISLPLFG